MLSKHNEINFLIFIAGFFSQENSQCLKIKLPEFRKIDGEDLPVLIYSNYEQKIKTDSEKKIPITVQGFLALCEFH